MQQRKLSGAKINHVMSQKEWSTIQFITITKKLYVPVLVFEPIRSRGLIRSNKRNDNCQVVGI